jgi:hypothetical protein
MDRETMKAMTAQRCKVCTGRVKLYRPTKYLNPLWRCDGCGRTEEVILEDPMGNPKEVLEGLAKDMDTTVDELLKYAQESVGAPKKDDDEGEPVKELNFG